MKGIGLIDIGTDYYSPSVMVEWEEWLVHLTVDFEQGRFEIGMGPIEARKLAAFIVEAAEKAEKEEATDAKG